MPQAEALLDQLARFLLLTTQLLEKHELTAQEAAQFEKIGPSWRSCLKAFRRTPRPTH